MNPRCDSSACVGSRGDDIEASLSVDRQLLYGMVALQMKFVDRVDLIDTMQECANDPTRTLSQVLLARKSLTAEESTLVDAAVERKLLENDDVIATPVDEGLDG